MLDRGVRRHGAWFLFSIRVTPLVPFFVVDLGMGLTAMRLRTFALVSWLGLLPTKCVLVSVGTTLEQVESVADVLSPGVLVSLLALGLTPLALRLLLAKCDGERQGRRCHRR